MTRDQSRSVWAIALERYGAARLEEIVFGHIKKIYASHPDLDLPVGVSIEGLAEIVRSLLDDILSGQRPLLVGDRMLNRMHLQALLQLKSRLDRAILADLPADLLTPKLRLCKAQIDFDI